MMEKFADETLLAPKLEKAIPSEITPAKSKKPSSTFKRLSKRSCSFVPFSSRPRIRTNKIGNNFLNTD